MSWEEQERKKLEEAEKIRQALVSLAAFDSAATLHDLILMAKRSVGVKAHPVDGPTEGPAAGEDQ